MEQQEAMQKDREDPMDIQTELPLEEKLSQEEAKWKALLTKK